jgi:hypothetical protein
VGSTITVNIRENSGSAQVNAVQANLIFDPTRLQYVSNDAATTDFPLTAITTSGNGTLNLTRAVNGGDPALTGDKLVSKVTFMALAPGEAAVNLATGSAISSTAGQDIAQHLTGSLITIAAAPVGAGSGSTPAPVTAPSPVVVTPVVGAKKPVIAKGTIKLTTPAVTNAAAAAVTYAIDNEPVTSDVVDTTSLDNGPHTVTATTSTGTKVQQKITVSNKVPLWKNIVAGIKTHATTSIAAVLFVGVLIGAGVFARRFIYSSNFPMTSGVRTNLADDKAGHSGGPTNIGS